MYSLAQAEGMQPREDRSILDVATDSLVWALDGYSLIVGAEHRSSKASAFIWRSLG